MIDHTSAIPLYQQVAAHISKQIHQGEFQSGDRLPSESQLCKLYGVSRITVRQALGVLTNEDLIHSVPGIGSFVKTIKIQQPIQRIVRFSEILSEKGISGRTVIRQFVPEVDLPDALARYPGTYSRMDLLGYVHKAPVVFYSSYISDQFARSVHAQAESLAKAGQAFSSYDLYDLLGVRIASIDQRITAIGSNVLTKEVFGMHGSPAYLLLESYYYTETSDLIEWKTAYYRSDIYSFHLERER